MNNDVELLEKFKGKLDKYVDKIDELVEGEMPELFREVLLHGRIVKLIYIMISMGILTGSLYGIDVAFDLQCTPWGDGCREINTELFRYLSIVGAISGLITLVMSIVSSIKVFFAPRLYIVDKLLGRDS